MLSDGFGAVEFQLVLLRRMADYQPALVDDARRLLGRSREEMRAANAHWQRLSHSPRFPVGQARYALVLGAPAVEEDRRIGDLRCRLARWRLPLWPELWFESVQAAARGPDLHSWLVRDPAAPAPSVNTLTDLAPWSHVVADLDAAPALHGVTHHPGEVPSRWRTTFTAPGRDGRPTAATAVFVHGLLQVIEPGAPAAGTR